MECLPREFAREKYFTQDAVMNNEWSRLGSFKAFPADSAANTLRLANAGFYYTGSGEEAVCYFCGLRNDDWTEDETVLEVHRRLSPHCRYICGGDTTNTAIHGDNTLKSVPNCSKSSYFKSECGKSLSETQFEHSKKANSENGTGNYVPSTHTAGQSSEKYEEKRNVCLSRISTQHAFLENQCVNHSSTNRKHDIGLKTVSTQLNGEIELYPGINGSRPKHSDYALLSKRQASFSQWPEQHRLDPADLAKAGFYSAGLQDCVRCFFCSVGMKNWQQGDNPWVEHARWSPNCAYVKLCKGQLFVNICSAAVNGDHVAVYDKESQLDQENIPDDWLIENVNSAAAKCVLSAGYRQEDVENGVLFARRKYGSTQMKAQFIMEYLLETNTKSPAQQLSARGNNETSEHVNQTYSEDRKEKPHNSVRNVTEAQTSTNGPKHKSEKQRLLEENRRLKDLITCKICLDNEACVAFLPCGHLTSCVECSKNLRKCAICRTVVQGTVRVYQA
ncbi:baculoviral IAP repeat-containing protein 3-like [Mercenaria mercenaria]|uniref:baculoviral IAP repeat-containing protein 3-like n=1 Tax=Mercenaria mercenaria TaxID=6596 RepID=UPI00234EA596|nr:baculoviral IAP repeat-containing protein 3-like [Mercenaria mercenaria]